MENRFERFEAKYDNQRNYEIILDYKESLDIPDPKNFMDTYSPKVIGEDLNRLRLIKRSIREDRLSLGEVERGIFDENKKRANCLEILLVDQVYDGDWFGSEAMAILLSEYDDILGGVDMVVEFDKEEPERMALAVDASTSSNFEVIEEKIRKNLEKLKKNKALQEVKYFESQIRDDKGNYYKGELKDLIPVVVGADKENVDNLFESFSELKYLEKENNERSKERRGEIRRELAKNPIQETFLQEIKLQLETYKEVLQNENIKVVNYCDSLLKIIDEIIEEKEVLLIGEKSDQVFNNIREVCDIIKEEGDKELKKNIA